MTPPSVPLQWIFFLDWKAIIIPPPQAKKVQKNRSTAFSGKTILAILYTRDSQGAEAMEVSSLVIDAGSSCLKAGKRERKNWVK